MYDIINKVGSLTKYSKQTGHLIADNIQTIPDLMKTKSRLFNILFLLFIASVGPIGAVESDSTSTAVPVSLIAKDSVSAVAAKEADDSQHLGAVLCGIFLAVLVLLLLPTRKRTEAE